MTVYIVKRNGKIDAVFDNIEAAENHRNNLNRKWSIIAIIEVPVLTI